MIQEWRRKYPRVSCFLPTLLRFGVLIRYTDKSKKCDGWAIIQDISLGGIRIKSRTKFEKGQPIFISFSITETYIFANTKGIVTRVSEDGIYYIYGVKFESLVDQNHLKEALDELVKANQ